MFSYFQFKLQSKTFFGGRSLKSMFLHFFFSEPSLFMETNFVKLSFMSSALNLITFTPFGVTYPSLLISTLDSYRVQDNFTRLSHCIYATKRNSVYLLTLQNYWVCA